MIIGTQDGIKWTLTTLEILLLHFDEGLYNTLFANQTTINNVQRKLSKSDPVCNNCHGDSCVYASQITVSDHMGSGMLYFRKATSTFFIVVTLPEL